MRNYYEVAGISTAGAAIAIVVQLIFQLWTFGLMPGQSGVPNIHAVDQKYLFWGVTPILFLASMVIARPSVKGFLLGAVIFIPVNIFGTVVLNTLVLGLKGVGL